MASKHFVLRIHTEPQKPLKGDKGHDNSCHTYHAYVYICLYLSMSLSIRVCRLSAMWPPFLFLGAALRARLLPPCSKGGPIETLRTTETENQRLLRIIFCYHIHKNQWCTRVDALLSRNTFPFPYGKPKFGTRFDGIRFQLRYCGAGELVVQMTCDCQNTKGSWIACQPFISLYIPHNFGLSRFLQTNTHPSTCVLWHHMLHIFPTLPDGAVWLIRGQYITIP